ncbi:hypothetical protein KY334_08035 [Candidatus Woesearchaeota archaeon]|nr:hypothetical protein [Candidatus Woesearchaeota archaeon]
MNEQIQNAKRIIEDECYLSLEDIVVKDGEKPYIDYENNFVYINDDVEKSIDILVQAYFFKNTLSGKSVYNTKKRIQEVENHIFGEGIVRKDLDSIIILTDEESSYLEEFSELFLPGDFKEENIKELSENAKKGDKQILVISKKEKLCIPYLKLSERTNNYFKENYMSIRGFSNWIKERLNILSNEEETYKENEFTKRIKDAKDNNKLLTFLRVNNFVGKIDNEYFNKLNEEHISEVPIATIKKNDQIINLYENCDEKTYNIKGILIHNKKYDSFKKDLFNGNPAYNDFVLEGYFLNDDKLLNEYKNHSFTNNNDLESKSKVLFQKAYQHSMKSQRIIENSRYVDPGNKTIVDKINKDLFNEYYNSINSCFEALRNYLFVRRISENPEDRFTTKDIIDDSRNEYEKRFSEIDDILKQSRYNPKVINPKMVKIVLAYTHNILSQKIDTLENSQIKNEIMAEESEEIYDSLKPNAKGFFNKK